MKSIRKNTAGLMMKWVISYVMIFIIPVAAGILVYKSAERIIRDDIDAVSSHVLAQLQLSFDNITSEVYGLTRQLALDSDINYIIGKTDFTPKDRIVIKKCVEKCQVYNAVASSVDDFYIYLKNSGCEIKSTGFVEKEILSSNIPVTGKYTAEDWEEIVGGLKNNQIIPYAYVSGFDTVIESVSFVVPISLYDKEPSAFVVASIDKSRYEKIAAGIYENSNFMVVDAKNNIVFSTADDKLSAEIAELINDDSISGINHRGTDYYIKQTYSGVNRLKYISVTEKNIAYGKLSHVRRIMLVSYFLCVLAGVFFAFYFSRRNYKPFKAIMDMMVKHKLLKNGDNSGEEALLIDAVSRLVQDKNTIDIKLYNQQDYVRTSVFSKLINNGCPDGEASEKMKKLSDLDFIYDNYALILFHIYENEERSAEDYEISYFVIKNIFEELINKYCIGYVAEINGSVCAVVNLSREACDGFKKEITEIFNYGASVILNNFQIELAAASSGVKTGLGSLSQCYSEACEAISNLTMRQKKDIIFYEDLINGNSGNYEYYFSFNKEQKLIESLKQGDFGNANNIIGGIIDKFKADDSLNSQTVRCVIADISAAIYKVACFLSENDFPVIDIMKLRELGAEDIKKELFASVEILCKRIIKENEQSENRLVLKAQEIIEREYSNVSLNISYIADKLEVNSTYISRIFSENTGDGLLNCINKYRVEKAKTLLKNPKLTIDTVAAMTGFTNSNSFIRVFKKYEYVTPGQYRAAPEKKKS